MLLHTSLEKKYKVVSYKPQINLSKKIIPLPNSNKIAVYVRTGSSDHEYGIFTLNDVDAINCLTFEEMLVNMSLWKNQL